MDLENTSMNLNLKEAGMNLILEETNPILEEKDNSNDEVSKYSGNLKSEKNDSGKGVNYRANYYSPILIQFAKELRQRQTPTEEMMWSLLKNRQFMGLKFRRQHQMGVYIVDFYCHEKRLIVELDGEVHNRKERKELDQTRDAYLKSLGFNILRFKNDEIYNNIESVLNKIAAIPSENISPTSEKKVFHS
jgi:very-short-patch-repair endonuclease